MNLKKAKYYIGDSVLVKIFDCYFFGIIKDINEIVGKIQYTIEVHIIDKIKNNSMVKYIDVDIHETDIVRILTKAELTDGSDYKIINTYNENLNKLEWCPDLYEGVLPEPEKNINTRFKKNEIVAIKETYDICIILETSFVSINYFSFGNRIYLIKNKALDSIRFIKESELVPLTPIDWSDNNKNKIDHSPVEVIIGDDDNTNDDSFKFNINDIVKFKQYEMVDGYILDTIYFKIEDRFTIKEKKYYALSVIDYIYINECGIIIRTEDQLELITDKLDDYSIHGYDTRRLLWKIKKFKE